MDSGRFILIHSCVVGNVVGRSVFVVWRKPVAAGDFIESVVGKIPFSTIGRFYPVHMGSLRFKRKSSLSV